MPYDVSGFGFQIFLIGSNTFPGGSLMTAFSDDTDPMDIPEITVADVGMGLNGDLISWSRAEPLKPKFAVIEGSPEDINLAILLEANRVGAGKTSARDIITATAIYPTGATVTFLSGKILGGMPAPSVASSGKIKTKTYMFAFQNRIGSGV